MIKLQNYTGDRILPFIEELAKLRIKVFYEYPYLYSGTLDYETRYLKNYAQYDSNLCVIATDAGKIIGASTAMRFEHADKLLQEPFRGKSDTAIEKGVYFGESILLSDYRGQGLGKQFFSLRESFARKQEANYCTFCAVDRPKNHPLKPKNYQNLHAFWQKLGYQHHPEHVAYFPWQDRDESEESFKPMSFWLKQLQ